MTLIDPRFIGKIGPAHKDYVRTDALNRADRAAAECACGGRNLRLSIREAVEELEHADHHGCAEIVRKTLWKQ